MSPGAGSWLITGASGFLGRRLLETIAAGSEPVGPSSTARRASSHPALALVRDRHAWDAMPWTRALSGVRTIVGSLDNTEAWSRDPALDGLAGIFHLAGLVRHGSRDAAAVHRTNVDGTLNLVRVAAEHRCRIVFVSTSGTVGCFRSPGPSADETAPYCEAAVRNWPYYRSKLEAERRGRHLADELGVDLVIVRPPVLLGPGDHRLRSSLHVLRLLRGRVPFLIRGGMHFADVRDVAGALLKIMEHPSPRPVYHLPGTVCSLKDFYQDVARLAGMRPPRITVPFLPAWLLARMTDRLGLHLLPEPALIEMASHYWAMHSLYAEPELGYRSRPGSETIRETIAWLRHSHPELAGA